MTCFNLIPNSPSPNSIPMPIPGEPCLRTSSFQITWAKRTPTVRSPCMPCAGIPCSLHWQRIQNFFVIKCRANVLQQLRDRHNRPRLCELPG
jgi:hypothetical protein